MTTRSAHPSAAPVLSNVPSTTVTRLSGTVFENCSRMPALGSTARSSLTLPAQSGCASRARVKMPVPDPILYYPMSYWVPWITRRARHALDDVQRRGSLYGLANVRQSGGLVGGSRATNEA